MFLNNNFYRVVSVERASETSGCVTLELLPECSVYVGHFPGKPVCPGVCNMETIKECACMVLQKEGLRYEGIKQCRLTAVATPSVCPCVKVDVNAESKGDSWMISGMIRDEERTYMELKGVLV